MASCAEKIWEMAKGFQPSRILLTGVELGIFAALGDETMTSAEVARKLGTDPRATDRLMNALAALDLLDKNGNLFSNTPDGRESLVPGKPDYVGGALMHISNLWTTWSTLTDAVRAGTSVVERDDRAMADYAVPFMAAMHSIAGRQASNVIEQIDLAGVRRVLDVGGGSGAYSIQFCRDKPDINAAVFDQPGIVPLTKDYVEQAGMTSRISTFTGNFNTDDLPGGFDLAFLSQVLHSNNPEENLELFKKCWKSLNPGGQIVIQEFVVDEGRTSPPAHVLFALNMLVGTRAGDTYTESEIEGWLEAASFLDARRVDPPGTETTLIMARKG
ncbi:MAG: acetylserotonin O-methyltransferase [Armatimonadetes bacterium]|nr:acetylserotonin O-methyltransferase [Armatimonadota bacterium]